MLSHLLPGFVRGIFCLIAYILVVIILAFTIYTLALIKYITPINIVKKKCDVVLNYMPILWSDMSFSCTRLFNRLDISLIGEENLKKDQWGLMTANHQSWTDILILHRVFNHRIPVLKFFMKFQILWIPFLGLACWLIGCPFMKRYTKEQLAKHPELKGKDLDTTKKMCARFKNSKPMTIISFTEGTRYTPEKAKRQKSPFKHLLKPRAGGLAYTLMAMEEHLRTFINVTIVYPDEHFYFWDYLSGKLKRVIVKIEVLPITDELRGNYHEDREYRVKFQHWLNVLWEQKDKDIDQLKSEIQ